MNIIIFGASGRTGSALVERGLAKGHTITAFVRDPQKLLIKDERLKVIMGDAHSMTDVSNALSGQDAIISAMSSGTLESTTQLSDSTQTIITAMPPQGLHRIIVILSMGLLLPAPPPQFINVSAEHRRIYQALQTTTLEWVAACPPSLTSEPGQGSYRAVAGGVPGGYTISRYDLADFMLAQIDSKQYLQQLVGVAN